MRLYFYTVQQSSILEVIEIDWHKKTNRFLGNIPQVGPRVEYHPIGHKDFSKDTVRDFLAWKKKFFWRHKRSD